MSFDTKAASWDASERRQALAENVAQAIKEELAIEPSSRILDFGAGTGLLTERLAEKNHQVVACDTSAQMLKKLRQKLPRAHCVVGDILAFESEEPFDLIVSSMTLHHIQDTTALFAKLFHLLRPGGYLAIADLSLEDGTFHDQGNDGVYHFGFEEESLCKQMERIGFADIRYRTVHTVRKDNGRVYDIFLLVATKPLSN